MLRSYEEVPRLLLVVLRGAALLPPQLRPPLQLFLVLLLGHGYEPREIEEHVIGRAVAVAFPVAGIGHARVAQRVVVPGGHPQQRALWQQRRDVFLVNGVAQPFFEGERRQYRFRVLNASNARFYQLRLSTKDTMLIVGTDTWLLPFAVPVKDFEISPGERHDIIVDFRNAPSEVFLENIMFQPDGRGPKEVDPDERVPLLKFRVKGDVVRNDLVIQPGTELREHREVPEDQIVATRVFRWERANGAWVNAADRIESCDFYSGAAVRRGPVQIAIGTGGSSPAAARVVRPREQCLRSAEQGQAAQNVR